MPSTFMRHHAIEYVQARPRFKLAISILRKRKSFHVNGKREIAIVLIGSRKSQYEARFREWGFQKYSKGNFQTG